MAEAKSRTCPARAWVAKLAKVPCLECLKGDASLQPDCEGGCNGTGYKYPLREKCPGVPELEWDFLLDGPVHIGWIHDNRCCDGTRWRDVEPEKAMSVILETWPPVYLLHRTPTGYRFVSMQPREGDLSSHQSWPEQPTAVEAVLAAKMQMEGLEVVE